MDTKYIWYDNRKRGHVKNVRLQLARKESGKSQKELASAVDISETMYQRYEYNLSEPGVRTAIRIADALGVVDIRELFDATEPEQPTGENDNGA